MEEYTLFLTAPRLHDEMLLNTIKKSFSNIYNLFAHIFDQIFTVWRFYFTKTLMLSQITDIGLL